MADEKEEALEEKSEAKENGAATDDEGVTFRILGQYLKDLSFENPNAPASLNPEGEGPNIDISVNVNANVLGDNTYEVELAIQAKATRGDDTVFAAELLYAGVFQIENFPEENLQPMILIECPRMLFPFARQILAAATRDGGFPPLLLDPIDFAGLFQQKVAEAAQENEQSSDTA